MGRVVRSFLRPDKTACTSLAADSREVCAVECRCLSDEVLAVARRGETAALRGFLAGFDDSVTLVLERCEMVRAGGKTRRRH